MNFVLLLLQIIEAMSILSEVGRVIIQMAEVATQEPVKQLIIHQHHFNEDLRTSFQEEFLPLILITLEPQIFLEINSLTVMN